MPLPVGATMTLVEYAVIDDGIVFRFLCVNPGAGMPSYYDVLMTDAELTATTTQPQLRNALTTKLQRKFQAASGIATRIDPLIGQTLTI